MQNLQGFCGVVLSFPTQDKTHLVQIYPLWKEGELAIGENFSVNFQIYIE